MRVEEVKAIERGDFQGMGRMTGIDRHMGKGSRRTMTAFILFCRVPVQQITAKRVGAGVFSFFS